MIVSSELLNLLDTPALIVDAGGCVCHINQKLGEMVPALKCGQSITNSTPDQAPALQPILRRAARSNEKTPCALSFIVDAAPVRLRGHCKRITMTNGDVLYAIVFEGSTQVKFKALSDQINQLNAEIVKRKGVETDLKGALDRNEMLLRELHHRVKNNVQIQMALLDQQAAFANDDAFSALAELANQRLWALSQSLHVMYSEGNFVSLRAEKLFMRVIDYLSDTFGEEVVINSEIAGDLEIANDRANTYALLMNELITHVYKQGLQGQPGTIIVKVVPHEDTFVMEVRCPNAKALSKTDDRETFGLILVRGLCQQIGANFTMENQEDTVCRVLLPSAN